MAINDETQPLKTRQSRKYPLGSSVDNDVVNKPYLLIYTILYRRWEDNIRMDLQEVGLGYEDWIGRAQDRDRWRALVCAVRNLRFP